MATNIKTLVDQDGNFILPRTRSTAITMSDGVTSLEQELANISGGNVTASTVGLTDTADYYTSTDVEGALQEVGNTLATHTHVEADITDLQSYLTTETDPIFTAWDKSTGISITESQVSDLNKYTQAEVDALIDTRKLRNYIINGGFDVWQRGTSFTYSSGVQYGSADRFAFWHNGSTSGTNNISRQAFTVGQTDVPNNPTYFLRWTSTTLGTGQTICSIQQFVEDVTKLAGKTVSLSFWAKSSSSISVDINFRNYYGGTFGNILTSTKTITTSWARYTITIALESASGATIGNNNSTSVQFLLNNMTAGQTFDIANVSLVEGSVPVEWQTEAYADVLEKCQDYYETGLIPAPLGYYTGSLFIFNALSFKKRKRVNPTLTITAESGAYMVVAGNYTVEAVNNAGWASNGATQHAFSFIKSKQGTGNATPTVASVYNWQGNVIYTADSEL